MGNNYRGVRKERFRARDRDHVPIGKAHRSVGARGHVSALLGGIDADTYDEMAEALEVAAEYVEGAYDPPFADFIDPPQSFADAVEEELKARIGSRFARRLADDFRAKAGATREQDQAMREDRERRVEEGIRIMERYRRDNPGRSGRTGRGPDAGDVSRGDLGARMEGFGKIA